MITPDVAQFTTLEYDRVDEIIQVGRDAAETAVPNYDSCWHPARVSAPPPEPII